MVSFWFWFWFSFSFWFSFLIDKEIVGAEGAEIEANTAVHGMVGAKEIEVYPLDWADGETESEVEVVLACAFSDIVIMINRSVVVAIDVDVDGGGIGETCVCLTIADNGHKTQPGKNGNLVAQIYRPGDGVVVEGVGYMVVELVFGTGFREVEIDAQHVDTESTAEVGIVGMHSHLSEMEADTGAFGVVGEIKPLGSARHCNKENGCEN